MKAKHKDYGTLEIKDFNLGDADLYPITSLLMDRTSVNLSLTDEPQKTPSFHIHQNGEVVGACEISFYSIRDQLAVIQSNFRPGLTRQFITDVYRLLARKVIVEENIRRVELRICADQPWPLHPFQEEGWFMNEDLEPCLGIYSFSREMHRQNPAALGGID